MFSVYMTEAAIRRVEQTLRSGQLAEGPVVLELEEAFYHHLDGTVSVVAVNSCTSALHLALVLAGVKAGDEVITTPQTMVATAQAIKMQGAIPVFADIQPHTGNIDPEDVKRRITDRTRAILCVHWGGYPCDLEDLGVIAYGHYLALIQDAAHALGATYKGWTLPGWGNYVAYSLQAIKHISAGDGGILTLPIHRGSEARRKRWYGIDRLDSPSGVLGERQYRLTEVGYKYHMNDIVASMAVENLKNLPWILARRQKIAGLYLYNLHKVPGVTMLERNPDRTHANWLFTMLVDKREDFCRAMRDRGVDVSVVHQRIDVHPVFGGKRDDLPGMDEFDARQISIPLHMGLSDEDVAKVIDSVKAGW